MLGTWAAEWEDTGAVPPPLETGGSNSKIHRDTARCDTCPSLAVPSHFSSASVANGWANKVQWKNLLDCNAERKAFHEKCWIIVRGIHRELFYTSDLQQTKPVFHFRFSIGVQLEQVQTVHVRLYDPWLF